MTRLVDLTASMDPAFRALVPKEFDRFDKIVAPEITYLSPERETKEVMMRMYGCPAEHLPDGEGYGSDLVTEMTTHCGTHVDAPLHSGRTIEGRPARTMSDIGLHELFRPGLVLDVRPWVAPDEGISTDALKNAIAATGREVQDGHSLTLSRSEE